MEQRTLTLKLAATSYTTRVETFKGREHIVVPVVALVEGVVHAMNAENPELVTAEEFRKAPGGWNGRPIYQGHPVNAQGVPLSGNSPELLELSCIGTVFNAAIRKNKLTMEAWVDVEAATERAPLMLARIRAGKPIEISVGVFVEPGKEKGVYAGKEYNGTWQEIVPDHLALLEEGDTGACSVEMGCGVRAASKETEMTHPYAAWLVPGPETDALLKTLSALAVADTLAADDYAGPNKSFPIATADDIASAASAIGRAKGDRSSIKRKIVAIAYRKGDAYVAKLPADWQRTDTQKNATMRGLIQKFKAFFRGSQNADEMTTTDLKRKLYEALQDVEPGLVCVEDYFPVTDPAHVVYTIQVPTGQVEQYGDLTYPIYDYDLMERAFTLSDQGTVSLSDTRFEVQPVMRYEPVEGTSPTVASDKNAGAGAPCSCKDNEAPTTANKETDMSKEKVTAFLATATPEQVTALMATVEPKVAEVVAPVVAAAAPAVVVTPAVVEPKAPTFDEILATADPATRSAIAEGRRLGMERKAATITALKATKRCTFTDVQLDAMDQAGLDQLVALAGSNVRAAVDFSAQAPRVASEGTEDQESAPEAPDMIAALQAKK